MVQSAGMAVNKAEVRVQHVVPGVRKRVMGQAVDPGAPENQITVTQFLGGEVMLISSGEYASRKLGRGSGFSDGNERFTYWGKPLTEKQAGILARVLMNDFD